MQFIDGQLVLSPTDLTRHQECRHLTALDLQVVTGQLQAPPEGPDDQLKLLFGRGDVHERRYLAHLQEKYNDIAYI